MLNGGILEMLLFRAFKSGVILKAQSVIVTVFASLSGMRVKAILMMLFYVHFSTSTYDHNRLFHIAAVLIVRGSLFFNNFLTKYLHKFMHWC